jgi:iron-sulfur cluster assembly protein
MGLVATTEEGDLTVESNGVKVFIDPTSVPYLEGTTIDFVIGMEGSGFIFDNPQAKSSCSCGKSFG